MRTLRPWAIVLAAAVLAGCNDKWPSNTVAAPNFEGDQTRPLPRYKGMAYSVDADVKLPDSVQAISGNRFVGPKGAELFVVLSRPWPSEEDAMGPIVEGLKSGKPFAEGDVLVVAKPWIGSREEKQGYGGKVMYRYLMTNEELFLDMMVKHRSDDEVAAREAEELVQHVLHSVVRVYRPRAEPPKRPRPASTLIAERTTNPLL